MIGSLFKKMITYVRYTLNCMKVNSQVGYIH